MKNIYDTINKYFEETAAEFGLPESSSICFKTDGELCQEYLTENISSILHQSLMEVITNYDIGSKWFDYNSSIYYRGGRVRIYGSKLICKYDVILRYYDEHDISDDQFISMLKTALRLEMGSIAHFQSFNGKSVEEYERIKRSYEEDMEDFVENLHSGGNNSRYPEGVTSYSDIDAISEWSEAIRISGITPEEIEKYSDILFDF
jgi:hypothetical protein